jgi:hypothetical protein
MGHGVWLRKRPVSRRVLGAAAVTAAAALACPALAAAGAPRSAWTKAWTEELVRRSYDAVTAVCLPLGPPVRRHGENAFRAFVCSLVTADGSRYTIHLEPRTQTTWKTISVERDRPASPGGGKPPKPHPQHGR